jgi:hypothetical protein
LGGQQTARFVICATTGNTSASAAAPLLPKHLSNEAALLLRDPPREQNIEL